MEENANVYECPICRTAYKTEEEVGMCASSHEQIDKITSAEYHSYKLDDSKYPHDILIKFTDGKVKRYQLT